MVDSSSTSLLGRFLFPLTFKESMLSRSDPSFFKRLVSSTPLLFVLFRLFLCKILFYFTVIFFFLLVYSHFNYLNHFSDSFSFFFYPIFYIFCILDTTPLDLQGSSLFPEIAKVIRFLDLLGLNLFRHTETTCSASCSPIFSEAGFIRFLHSGYRLY